MEPKTIDRLSSALVNVRPTLSSVTSLQELQAWADAAVELASVWAAQPRYRPHPRPDRTAAPDAAGHSASEVFGLRHWEEALSKALARLRALERLPPEVDVTALGSAFAAMLYGGLLLTQTTGTSVPLRAALDMALGQIRVLAAK